MRVHCVVNTHSGLNAVICPTRRVAAALTLSLCWSCSAVWLHCLAALPGSEIHSRYGLSPVSKACRELRMTQPDGWRSAVSEFREREFCTGGERATWEGFVIPLSLFCKDVLGAGGERGLGIGWARPAVAHQSPRRSPFPSPRVTQTRFDVCRERERGRAGAERPASVFNEALRWSSSGWEHQRQKLSSRCRGCWVITPLIACYVTPRMAGNWHLEPDYI